MNDLSQQVKDFLIKGDIAKALSTFLQNNTDPDTENSLILLSGRWNRLRQEEINGTIARADANVDRARIQHAILEMVDMISPPSQAQADTPNSPMNQAEVSGDGNIVIQGVTGSTINIYPS